MTSRQTLQSFQYSTEDGKFPSSTRRRSRKCWERWCISRNHHRNRLSPHHGSALLTYPKKANGKLRICLDPKDLNKAIISENHKAPTLEQIAHVLTGATKFPKWMATKHSLGCTFGHSTHTLAVQISMCTIWTQNESGHFPDENGWHCSPMPRSIGHTWQCIHIWEGQQRPWCQHHKLVQCSPKRRTNF